MSAARSTVGAQKTSASLAGRLAASGKRNPQCAVALLRLVHPQNLKTPPPDRIYDLAKVAVSRVAWAHAKDLEKHGASAVSTTPTWLRSEMMMEAFAVRRQLAR